MGSPKDKRNVVVIGGGHGQSAVLKGLKNCRGISLTAIVTVADDGGSTGRLRREFHIPAVGDIRNVMTALAEEETMFTRLMDYRFEDDEGVHGEMSGHNLGNLVLTALTRSSGSLEEAVRQISSVLKVQGKIVPSTNETVTLYAVMEDGTIVKGESNIPRVRNKITRVYYDHPVRATGDAVQALREADYIVYGIGSLYTSILPNLIIDGIRSEIQKSGAKKIYFCNSMTQAGETEGYTMEDHVEAIEKTVGSSVDVVYYADDAIPSSVLQRYRKENAEPVRIGRRWHRYEVRRRKMLDFSRNNVRHDSDRIRQVFEEELEGACDPLPGR